MLLTFEQRLSPSPFVERVWRSRSEAAGTFYSMAEPNLELVIARVQGRTKAIVRGPVTRASVADCPADGEWLGIRLRLGVYLRGLSACSLRDHQSAVLPDLGPRAFRLGGQRWELPTYENAECLVARLAAAGVIAQDEVVDRALGGHVSGLGPRSLQRRFLRATGISRESLLQIERARFAAQLLRDGAAVLDVVDQAGYFDQPHLSRALRRLVGPTPAALSRGEDQLSLLYKTTPPPWT